MTGGPAPGGVSGWGVTPRYLQVVFPVDGEAVAERVPHDQQVGVLAVHAQPVHAQEAGQQRAPVTLHHVLRDGHRAATPTLQDAPRPPRPPRGPRRTWW